MRNLFRFIGLRHMSLRPGRTLFTAAGIALGMALFMSIQIINRSTLSSFQESVEAVTGTAALTITAGETGFDESLLEEKILKVPGVKHAVPMVETRAYFVEPGKPFQTVMIFGVDLLREGAVRTYKTADEQIIEDPLIFLNQPDSIIVTKKFAADHNLVMDSKLELSTAQGKKTFTVRGMLSPQGPAKAYGGGMAIMDIDGARVTFGKENKIDRVDIVPVKGEDIKALKTKLSDFLGHGFAVEEPETQTENKRRMVAAFQALLSFLSSLALVVGIFLVANSVSVTVAERRREIGTLRALGATRRSILTLILSESFVVGVVSSLIGALLGRGLAELLVDQVTAALASQYLTTVATPALQFGARDLVFAGLVGALASVGAAFFPAYKATTIQPVEALKPKGALEEEAAKKSRFWRYSPAVGAAVLVYLFIFDTNRLGQKFPLMMHVNAPAGIIAATLVAPFLVQLMVRLLRNVIGMRFSIVFFVALENLLRNPRRTGSNILSLIVGLCFVILISSVNISFRKTMVDWADKVMSYGRVIVSSNGRLTDFQVSPLHESVAEKLKKVEGVELNIPMPVFAMRFVRTQYQGKEIGMKAVDPPPPDSNFRFLDTIDIPAVEAGKKIFDPVNPEILISQNLSQNFNIKTGQIMEIATPTGWAKFKIAGMMSDYANPNGTIYLSRDLYKKHWNDPLVTGFSVVPQANYSLEKLRANIDQTLGPSDGLVTTLASELVADIGKIIDETFKFNDAIEFAALLVGLLGLMNTLLISIMERTRELGMLRAIGMERRQMFTMILIEALIQGALGAIVAAFLGAYLAYLWITSTMQDMLGWIIYFHFPWKSVVITLALGIIAALLSGLLPSRRAANLEVRSALEYE